MSQQTTYFINLNKALMITNQNINTAQLAITDEYSDNNYPQIVNDLTQVKRQIIRMLNLYKFLRLSRQAFIDSLSNPGNYELTYVVTSFDTPLGIARKFNITLDQLLQTNNIRSGDITTGMTLKILTTQQVYQSDVYNNIPVFGTQDGLNILGTDLPNALSVDETGDLSVLGNTDTVTQGVNNIITTKQGDYPGEDDFGISRMIGGDNPADLNSAMLLVKVLAQLSLDARITKVENLTTQQNQNAIVISTGNITVLNNKTSLSISPLDQQGDAGVSSVITTEDSAYGLELESGGYILTN